MPPTFAPPAALPSLRTRPPIPSHQTKTRFRKRLRPPPHRRLICQFGPSGPPEKGLKRRPDASDPYPPFIPQTIEFALRESQRAVAAALQAGHARLLVELPMGRSRKYWYRMSPLATWLQESAILAFHFAELFKGLHITLVVANGAGVAAPVPWVAAVMRLDEVVSTADFASPRPDDRRVVIIAAATSKQRRMLDRAVELARSPDALILFNCMLDDSSRAALPTFTHTYICRALEKCAVMLEGHAERWNIFAEIAVFEYEWLGGRERLKHAEEDAHAAGDELWVPTQKAVEAIASQRGARRRGLNGYYETPYAGCEAGFWPFMTIACEQVLPIDGARFGDIAEKKAEKKAKKSNARPFGFF